MVLEDGALPATLAGGASTTVTIEAHGRIVTNALAKLKDYWPEDGSGG